MSRTHIVEWKEPRLQRIGGTEIRLRFGTNEVDAEEWERVAVGTDSAPPIRLVAHYVDKGTMKVRAEDTSSGNLKNVPEKEACAIVGDCYDPALLAAWDVSETRVAVKRALVAQQKEWQALVAKAQAAAQGQLG